MTTKNGERAKSFGLSTIAGLVAAAVMLAAFHLQYRASVKQEGMDIGTQKAAVVQLRDQIVTHVSSCDSWKGSVNQRFDKYNRELGEIRGFVEAIAKQVLQPKEYNGLIKDNGNKGSP